MAKKEQSNEKMIAQNRRARHDYEIEDTYEAGLALTGTEVKSLREGRASLAESCLSIDKRGEVWLEGANIPEYLNGTWNNHAPKRKRKLLLHRNQIDYLDGKLRQKGMALVPLELYFDEHGRVKLAIGLCRGKKLYDKRDDMARRDTDREIQRALKERSR